MEIYIDGQEIIKPKSSSNHDTDEPDVQVANINQEILRKYRAQEARNSEIMKGVEEIGEINEELKVESSDKERTERERHHCLQKVEIIEGKEQQVEETTTEKDYYSISENIINKGMESKMTCNKITYKMSLNE